MSKLRLVKITDALETEVYYQIQHKTFLFGWIAIGNRRNGVKCTFTSLDDAKKYYNAYKAEQLYKTEVIELTKPITNQYYENSNARVN